VQIRKRITATLKVFLRAGARGLRVRIPFWLLNTLMYFFLSYVSFVGKVRNLLKRTGYLMHQQVSHSKIVHSAHTVFMCFVFTSISERTATFALYNRNVLVFITEIKSVYCAVRTGPLNKTVYASCLKGLGRLISRLRCRKMSTKVIRSELILRHSFCNSYMKKQ
jgi:hypothetical protein